MEERHMHERTRVMIVEPDWDFGIKLADWLAAHGYQPVLVRSINEAIAELSAVRPQAVFIGLGSPDQAARIDASEALLLIQTICPRAPVITIGDDSSLDLTPVVVRQGVRRFLVKPVEFEEIGHVLQSELCPAGA